MIYPLWFHNISKLTVITSFYKRCLLKYLVLIALLIYGFSTTILTTIKLQMKENLPFLLKFQDCSLVGPKLIHVGSSRLWSALEETTVHFLLPWETLSVQHALLFHWTSKPCCEQESNACSKHRLLNSFDVIPESVWY